MKAVILAGGEGLRCRPLTLTRSKVMLPVANRPILEHVIHALEKNGIKDIVLVVGYEKERIMDYFEDGVSLGVSITYKEQKTQLGTAHAINQAAEYLKNESEFLVLNGDNIIEPETIKDIIDGHSGDATILASKMQNISKYGVIVSQDSRIKQIIEKPSTQISHLVNTGIYVFSSAVFEFIEHTPISEKGEYAITDTIQLMVDSGMDVNYVTTGARWMDAVYVWDLIRVNATVLDTCTPSETPEFPGSTIQGNVHIGKDTVIYPGCQIIGPVMIGNGCEIGPNTVILPSTTIGDNCSVGSFTQIQNSIIMQDTRISSHGHISNSIIASGNTIGSHFITEEKEDLRIEMKGKLRRAEKLGTVIGDYNTIGHRVLVRAGIMISTNCQIESENVIYRKLTPGSTVL
ncbi:Nucleotidyl transferase [Methanosalsum zhilinae DSM 4017]|uniref:Bifunctional protein GlmU n=1 Tax=Methanosalsum zhilinae (strain DSM 4017 / NBRC 107636 / OCM 62 / WeN5) TaxID=679901 RepID=F7XPW8_METZD|nr:bifunctional sugar-1-phosphate nucleotidylyltransferase/acetyltransferase [Methanosalsum zhilinae]AEH61489.1 Nucleotidyl transferase [Methanosalsum zhilinae DSM 4017]